MQELVTTANCPVKAACASVGMARSTFYYQAQRRNEDQLGLDLEQVAGQYPKYGTRRITHQLRRAPYHYRINRKRVQRIMRQKRLLRPVKRTTYRTTNSQHPYPRYPNLMSALEIVRPEQAWVCDITYIKLRQGFVFLAIVMDVFTRAIRGWNLSHNLDVDLTLTALQRALSLGLAEIHHSDQGVQYAAQAYTDLLKKYGVQISMAAQGKPEENGYAERLMRTIKEEEVDLSEYMDLDDARRQIGCFIDQVYMIKRIHSALGYLTPTEFEADWQRTHLDQTTP